MDKTKADDYYVYILTNQSKTVLYIGITDDLKERLFWHRNPEAYSLHFTHRYDCYHLVYYEHFLNADMAIKREKRLKSWRREKKEILIKEFNPAWKSLNSEI